MKKIPLVLLVILWQMLSASVSADDVSASTRGLAPPDEAVVLFDGSNFDAWKPFSWQLDQSER